MFKQLLPSKKKTDICIIACAVFKSAMEQLHLRELYPDVRISYIQTNLHMEPQKLKASILKRIAAAKRKNEEVICLFGDCFPDINAICQRHGIKKVHGHHCYEMLLGTKHFNQIVEETAGTYFLEKDLILGFEELCMRPLELYDEEIRNSLFEHYQKLVYVRQPADSDLKSKASELAQFLGLSLDIENADYTHLERELTKLLRRKLSD